MSKPGMSKKGHLNINCSTYLQRDWKDKKSCARKLCDAAHYITVIFTLNVISSVALNA